MRRFAAAEVECIRLDSRSTKALALGPARGAALGAHAASPPAEKLGSFPVDPAQVSVAGFSSGAFMANQLHIAHSAGMMGAAMIAGGLYGCAVQEVTQDGVLRSASQAFGPCVRTPFMLDDVATYKKIGRQARRQRLDRSAVAISRGPRSISSPAAPTRGQPRKRSRKGKALYHALGVPAGNIVFDDRSGPAAKAGHAWVTNGLRRRRAPPTPRPTSTTAYTIRPARS